MDFTTTNNTSYSVITIQTNKLNSINAPDLKALITNVCQAEKIQSIIIDFSNVNYCDSSGLSAILLANRLCSAANGSLILSGLQPMVKKIIEIAQLHRVLTIVDTLEEAQAKFN